MASWSTGSAGESSRSAPLTVSVVTWILLRCQWSSPGRRSIGPNVVRSRALRPRRWSQGPYRAAGGGRLVAAEGAGACAGAEVVAEARVVLSDAGDGVSDDPGHVDPGPFAERAGRPVPAPQAHRGRQLIGEGVE